MTDWEELRVRYIAGRMSLKQLAEDSGVSYSQISKHASREQWAQQRKLFGKKVANNSLARAQARAQANLESALKVSEGLLQVAVNALNDKDQFRRYLVQRTDASGGSETTEEVFKKIDTKAVKELTEAVDKLTALLRVLMDEPDEAEKQRRKTERLRQEELREKIRQLRETGTEQTEPRMARFESEEEYHARTGIAEAEQETVAVPEG